MNVLLFGGGGFIGRAIHETLSLDHDVSKTVRGEALVDGEYSVDLLDPISVKKVIELTRPEVIVNAAGIVDPNADSMQNVEFTRNILDAVVSAALQPKRIIICGSAAEYGNIQPGELPVAETTPLRADKGYGYAKKVEEETALAFRQAHNLGVVVARIFNPIGPDMAEKFLVSRLKAQINEYEAGERTTLELHRVDSKRDYVAVDDIAKAIKVLVEGEPTYDTYNVGSGISMSNGDLLQLMINSSKIEGEPKITETSPNLEPAVASQADITRLAQEFGWSPQHTIAEIVEEIMND